MYTICNQKAVEIKKNILEKNITCQEVVEKFYQNIGLKEDLINAFITLTKEKAQKKAEELDIRIKNGEKVGKLAGIPIAIKDNINIKNIKMTCGSKILENFISPYNATIIEKLEAEDAIIIGKTNMDEFAMGSSCETSYFGPTKNPVDLERIPGGSSGGSAASVSANFAPLSIGSDTGGSIRQPASLCGIYGLKPTYGRVSRFGLVAFASSLDQIGPFAKSTDDLALLQEVIAGYDQKDSTCSKKEVPSFTEELKKEFNVKGLRIGLPSEYFAEGLDPEVKAVIMNKVEMLKNAGAIIKNIKLPNTDYAVAVYYIIAPSEASSNLARYDGVKYGFRAKDIKNLMEEYTKTRAQGFGDEVKRRIMIGTYALSSGYYDAYYLKAQKVRNLIAQDYENAWKEVDLIITPTSPTTAFKIGEKMDNPLAMYLSDIYTISVNLAGVPAISIPVGFDSKSLPVGLQIIGKHFDELGILKLSKFMEKGN
jgi:aspartyl-tRNA(Asn)/glutamyl-tRNA(Gln) amidotransferase subunit A